MKKIAKVMISKVYRPNLLAASIAAVCTTMVASSVTQASDIDIYQEAKSGQVTLMMMLDISTSMNGAGTARTDFGLSTSSSGSNADCTGSSSDTTAPNYGYSRTYCTVSKSRYTTLSTGDAVAKTKAEKIKTGCNIQSNGDYHCGDRTARMKDALYELLNGNADKGITKLDDNIVIGLSTFGADNSNKAKSKIWIPARRLGCKAGEDDCYQMTGSKSQRELMTDRVKLLSGISYTPTAWGYAEVINYMMGTRPSSRSNGFDLSESITKIGSSSSQKYQKPASLEQLDDIKKCSGQGIYVLTDGEPNATSSNTKDNMQTGLSQSNFTCTTSNSWDCQHKGARELVNKNNGLALEVRTAVVGFGAVFEELNAGTPYNKKLGQATNITNLGGCTVEGGCNTNPKNAAYWGIVGNGGWYAGSSAQSVVDSVINFITDLNTDVPPVTTGSPTIPTDALNPAILQSNAYYPQFQPTPDKAYQLWVGNLKKYTVSSTGALVDKNSNAIIDSQGRIIDNYDLWATSVIDSVKDADVNTYGSTKYALQGGAWSQLKLRIATDSTHRKLLTNRTGTGTGTGATFSGSNSTLRPVNLDYLTDNTYKDDPNRGYLMSLLGYAVSKSDAENPANITATTLANASELRQIGAVMHSTPVLVTNGGKLVYNATTKTMDSEKREDYVLFGTTQGLLQVVDAETGKEKFAFVPHEMIENQPQAFLATTTTSGGMDRLYYGIDGAWATYTEYVVDSTGNLTAGTGKNNVTGMQLAAGGMRMGGRSYYGLDLSDMDDPKLQFHINPTGTCSNTNPLGCMGQSWSKPTFAHVSWGGKRTLVMFVGGGYDNGYESDSYDQTTATGAGVYMFRVEDETDGGAGKAGDLLWWASSNATSSSATTTNGTIGTNNSQLKYSVVSQIRAVDRNGDDLVDHLYFGDLGGQVFRIDLNNHAAAQGAFATRVQRILDLNTNTAAGKRPRFYDMPAFSLYSNNGSIFAVMSIGSGNRSSPMADYASGTSGRNYDAIYNVYDKDQSRKDLYSLTSSELLTTDVDLSAMGEVTDTNRNDNTDLVASYASSGGWYYYFKSDQLQSEKVFGTPVVLNYQLYASTFDSSKDGISGDCGAGVKGESFLNRFCMPYGQCAVGDAGTSGNNCTGTKCDKTSLGAGIQTAAVRGGDATKPDGGSGSEDDTDGTSAGNYCLSTGSRAAYTPLGGGTGEQTKICLIPQRWYEKLQ